MSETPWLTIVGLGEDGPEAMSPASLKALEDAEIIMGAPRHLALLPDLKADRIEWPIPFSNGIPILAGLRGHRVVVLASGDPFWYGAGSVLARNFAPAEWRALAGPATFSLAAAHMGWPLEDTICIGLHAAPLSRLRPHLGHDAQAIVLLRDGAAVADLGAYLEGLGFGDTEMTVMEALGGPRQKVRTAVPATLPADIAHPVCVALKISGKGAEFTHASGRADALFANDGQITKRPVRALTLSALAPAFGEHLWDLGAGSGSIAIEWLLSHPSLSATAVEVDPTRAERATQNALHLGVDRLKIVNAAALDVIAGLPKPDVVFIGGGVSQQLLDALWQTVPMGTRIVANAVTLEAEALLAKWHGHRGGELLRIELAHSKPLGSKRGWSSAYPIVQWSVTR
ncbi:precorrin-6y C5,15-methyltransferase (decarboxylating) subunit CbiE [Pseudosulfitobacter sp. SM2401]|uniref:precorrin-6y C5,15-methyltransferase (decarboxylating) subunit CbiE n=1 Tax=Pseudosulfitobacter sp. SM2401 TaxID=3350098 RepID=UPI0036F2C94E